MIGQAPVTPATKLWEVRAILTTPDGSQIVRPGFVFSNTGFYQKFFKPDGQPDPRPHMAMIGLKGNRKGQMFYMPVDEAAQTFGELDPVQKAQVLASLDYAGIEKQDITFETFIKALDNSYMLAEAAALEIKTAWYVSDDVKKRAKEFLFGFPSQDRTYSRGGALGDYDRAIIELRILRSFDMVTEGQFNDLWRGSIEPLRDGAIAKANQIISASGQWLLDFLKNLKWLTEATAVNLRGVATAKWKDIESVYGKIARSISGQEATIKKLEALNPKTRALMEIVQHLRNELAKRKLALSQLDTNLRSYGVDLSELRKNAGLGSPPIPAIIVAVGAGLKVAALWAIKNAIVQWIIGMIVSTLVSYYIFKKLAEHEQQAKDLKDVSDALRQASVGEAGSAIGQYSQDNVDLIKAAAALADNDPILKAKAQTEQSELDKAIEEAKKAGAQIRPPVTEDPKVGTHPTGVDTKINLAIGLGIVAVGIALVLYFRRR